ncbi:MAG TPA: sigma-70 family RNA polymerase sigma factor [Gaiellaceae bacterium]|nr:sigma-70 family RNA polymerase sigma factor [Gaiellaceae bacterium]
MSRETERLSGVPDAELVRRCRSGDQAAWEALVERYSRYVYAICTRGFRLSDDDAEDVFQDVFARVFTHLDRLRDASALRPWIAQLTRRRCLDAVSGQAREQPAAEPLGEDVEGALDELDEAFAVREALGQLSEACQEILDRFFARDQSYRTISADLALPAGTIASRIARCLRRLRSELEGRSEGGGASRE